MCVCVHMCMCMLPSSESVEVCAAVIALCVSEGSSLDNKVVCLFPENGENKQEEESFFFSSVMKTRVDHMTTDSHWDSPRLRSQDTLTCSRAHASCESPF